jgi:hypothetical protein
VKTDRALQTLMSREFNITYGVVMCLAFGAVALFWTEDRAAQMVWSFGSGVHAGITFMWLIAPRVTANWKRQMEAELNKITEECLARMHSHVLATWSPSIMPPDDEPRRGMH